MKKKISPEKWEQFYMGDDGQFTMYIDLTKGVFARSSTSEKTYPIKDTIDEMFDIIKK